MDRNALNNLIAKAAMIGALDKIECYDKTTIYAIRRNNLTTIYIPDDVSIANGTFRMSPFHIYKGNVKVVGGKGLVDTKSMFSSCEFDTLDLSELDTSNVRQFSYMFNAVRLNSELDLSSLNTSKAHCMKAMFQNLKCSKITLGNFDTHNVEDMSYMFHDCSAEVDISQLDTRNVTNMSFMLSRTTGNIHGFDKLNTHNVINMNALFSMVQTYYLDISTLDTSNVVDCESMFRGVTARKIVINNDFSKSNTFAGMFQTTRCQKLVIEKFETSAENSMAGFFFGADIHKLSGLENIKTVGTTNLKAMFYSAKIVLDNPGIEKYDFVLNHFDTSKVEKYTSMFYNFDCRILDISNFRASAGIKTDMMFKDCRAQVIEFGDFNPITDEMRKGSTYSLFSGCSSKINTAYLEVLDALLLAKQLDSLSEED